MNVLNQAEGNGWILYNGDCVPVTAGLPSNSIDYCVHSPPFANLYIYSDSAADMGNCVSSEEFFTHYRYVIRELHRVTVPGRLCSVHCKDLPLYRGRDGAAGLDDFPGDIVRAFKEEGWVFHSRCTIWKDPVIEMQRTKNHGLLHKHFVDRSEVCRQGMADYILTFRKWDGLVENTTSPKPVKHDKHAPSDDQVETETWKVDPTTATDFGYEAGTTEAFRNYRTGGGHPEYVGERPPVRWRDDRDYSIQVWQRYASPVWFDIDQTDVLNYELAKDPNDDKHICPLQLGVIRRCIDLWTNPGDVVFSPCAGVGSEGVVALEMGRKFVGVELKDSYFRVAQTFLRKAEQEQGQLTLFDYMAQLEAA